MTPVKLRRSIGYVIQDGGLFPHRNVLENIATVPLLEGVSRAKAAGVPWNYLNWLGLKATMLAVSQRSSLVANASA